MMTAKSDIRFIQVGYSNYCIQQPYKATKMPPNQGKTPGTWRAKYFGKPGERHPPCCLLGSAAGASDNRIDGL
jgi:hypothetical protein